MIVIGCLSQKGGVGKSTLSRDIARQFASAEWIAKIADLDTSQQTSTSWTGNRMQNGIEPVIQSEPVSDIRKMVSQSRAAGIDILVIDGKPHSDRDTKVAAEQSDLIVIPTGPTLDDLQPQVRLGHELVKTGIPRERIVFVLNNIATSPESLEANDARAYIEGASFRVIKQAIPKRASYQNAQNMGLSISEARHPSMKKIAEAAVEEIYEIVESINGN